jgi:hypothetical protein
MTGSGQRPGGRGRWIRDGVSASGRAQVWSRAGGGATRRAMTGGGGVTRQRWP